MLASLAKFSLLSLAFPLAALASSHGNLLNRHHNDVAKRQSGSVSTFDRRISNARLSFYNAQTGNAGSCGQMLPNSGFTVAMNAAQMNPSFCHKTISISWGGKTTTATVEDTCPGCPYGGLDLTEGLFSYFASQSVGILYGQWEFTDGSGGGNAAPPAPPAPATTKKTSVWKAPIPVWTPPPVTTHKETPKPPTSTWTPPTTTWSSSTPSTTSTSKSESKSKTSTTSSTTSSAAASSINYLTGPASGLAIPTGSFAPPANSTENFAKMYQAFVQMGALIAGAGTV